MLALADMGLQVTAIEQFDPDRFAADPEAHIRLQTGDDHAADWIIAQTIPDLEAERVRACMEHPNIEFQIRQPTITDIIEQSTLGTVITTINSRALAGNPGYIGHLIVIVEATPDQLTLDNPGLPAIEHQQVPIDQFVAGWHSPQPTLANLMTVSARPAS